MSKYYCVYIITNSRNTVLYTWVTGSLVARIYHHRHKSVSSFSSKYNLEKLIYYEIYEDISLAIKREKQIKAGSRKKKIDLINKFNQGWKDLYSSIIWLTGLLRRYAPRNDNYFNLWYLLGEHKPFVGAVVGKQFVFRKPKLDFFFAIFNSVWSMNNIT